MLLEGVEYSNHRRGGERTHDGRWRVVDRGMERRKSRATLLPLWDRVIGTLATLGLVWARARLIHASRNGASSVMCRGFHTGSPDSVSMKGNLVVISLRMIGRNNQYLTHFH